SRRVKRSIDAKSPSTIGIRQVERIADRDDTGIELVGGLPISRTQALVHFHLCRRLTGTWRGAGKAWIIDTVGPRLMDQQLSLRGMLADELRELIRVRLIGRHVVTLDAGLLDGHDIPAVGLQQLFETFSIGVQARRV